MKIDIEYRDTCEESLSQIKENIAGSIQHTTNVQYIYTRIVDQIDKWVDQKLIEKPVLTDTLKDIVITPTLFAQM